MIRSYGLHGVNYYLWKSRHTCNVFIFALAVYSMEVSGLVQHSTGLQPEYTVKLHEGGQEKESRQWLARVIDG